MGCTEKCIVFYRQMGLGCIGRSGSGRWMLLLIPFPGAELPPMSGDVNVHVTFRGRNCRDCDILPI